MLFEIIIVNNEQEHRIPSYFDFYKDAAIKVLHEPSPGSYAARNAALKIARGDIIGFTDSDCIPDKDWIRNALRYFEDQSLDRLAGRIKIFHMGERKTLAELYETVFAFDQRRNVLRFRASVTANFFVRRECFDRVGLFDLWRKSGEDFGWNRRATSLGLTIMYGEDVFVYHPARATITELIDKRRRVYGGNKIFRFNNVRNILKEILFPLIIIYTYLLAPLKRLVSSELTWIEKFKVSIVIVILYISTQIEHFRLLLGGTPKR